MQALLTEKHRLITAMHVFWEQPVNRGSIGLYPRLGGTAGIDVGNQYAGGSMYQEKYRPLFTTV
ncbi:hypothetical protein CHU_2100 [Cytophaga hutchinsonii ATCC 33406]|uniref:Uncharacterized protein n=1 Tax=Cytophaga hutchinsonii (strain ATCC 33406 / DSM 1761 / CIP 103989 / NBRC 15051 / NCIMB 9469 / D465) TaxID=269798 RepID=A0A6N4SSK5_CYTH3|nr:hypothetical protein CHU_2100 [Cytophaga hutchinsonii ATCC 33406]